MSGERRARRERRRARREAEAGYELIGTMVDGLVDNLAADELGRALAAIVKATAPLLPAETEEQRAALQRVLDAADDLLNTEDEPSEGGLG